MKARDHNRILKDVQAQQQAVIAAMKVRHASEIDDFERACNSYVAHLEDQERIIGEQAEQIEYLQREVTFLRGQFDYLRPKAD